MRNSITQAEILVPRVLFIAIFILAIGTGAKAQRVAVVAPEFESPASLFAEAIESKLDRKFRIINRDLAAAAMRATVPAEPFNMSADDASNLGEAIGADYYIIVRSKTQRRAGRGDEFYFDTFGAIYVVASRTGELLNWEIRTTQGKTAIVADKLLLETAAELASMASVTIGVNHQASAAPKVGPAGPPNETSPEFKRFQPPAPYRRIAPAYTPMADLYAIEATVDIEVDFDAEGKVTSTRVDRWAGFGLDQSVRSAVYAMNWRPAFQDGKARPIRVLLRYNFRKPSKQISK